MNEAITFEDVTTTTWRERSSMRWITPRPPICSAAQKDFDWRLKTSLEREFGPEGRDSRVFCIPADRESIPTTRGAPTALDDERNSRHMFPDLGGLGRSLRTSIFSQSPNYKDYPPPSGDSATVGGDP